MTKTKFVSKKLIALVASVILLATLALVAVPLISQAAGDTLAKNTGATEAIDVYLIAGQSNAEGYNATWSAADEAGELADAKAGYEGVYFWTSATPTSSNADGSNFTFKEVTLGMMGNGKYSGAEIGIAAAAAKKYQQTGTKTVIIKVAVGGSFLYPCTSSGVSVNNGTWTSPSFIEYLEGGNDTYYNNESHSDDFPDAYLGSDFVNLSATSNGAAVTYAGNTTVNASTRSAGRMYYLFLQNVKSAVAALSHKGYSANLRGMWWMQGEAETASLPWGATHDSAGTFLGQGFTAGEVNGYNSYSKALECLVSDLRGELSREDFGFANAADNADMPFVLGRIRSNQDNWYKPDGTYDYNSTTGLPNKYQLPHYIHVIQKAQSDFAARTDIDNLGLVDIENYELVGNCTSDQWHFNAKAQKWLGEQFYAKVQLLDTAPSAAGNLVTKYGEVPAADAGKNFAVFLKQGNGAYQYVGASDTWCGSSSGALDLTYNQLKTGSNTETFLASAKKEVVIYLTKNCSLTENGFLGNVGHLSDDLVVDLGGHTMEYNSANTFMHLQYKPSIQLNGTGRNPHFTFKNGTLTMTGNSCLLWFDSYQSGLTHPTDANQIAPFDIDFTNVRITCTRNELFRFYDTAAASQPTTRKVKANINFNNCDITMLATAFDVFDANDISTTSNNSGTASVESILNVVVNGGYLRMPNLTSALTADVIAKQHATNGSSVKIYSEKDASGKVIPQFKLLVNQSTAPQMITTNGVLSDVAASVSAYSAAGVMTFGRLTTYSVANFGELFVLRSPQNTKHGTAPAYYVYNNSTSYPLLAFDSTTSSLVYATSVWASSANSNTSVLEYAQRQTQSNAKTITILLTADYTPYKSGESEFNNATYAARKGQIVVDLGGYTYSVDSNVEASKAAVNLVHRSSAASSVMNWSFKNGTVYMVDNSPFIRIGASAAGDQGKTNITFENLKFITNTTAAARGFDAIVKAESASIGNSEFNITMNNCTVNMTPYNFYATTTAAGSAGYGNNKTVRIVDTSLDTANLVKVNLTINGGELHSPTLEPASGIGTNNKLEIMNVKSLSTLTFGKYNGSYVTLYHREGVAAPIYKVNSATGAVDLSGATGDIGFISIGTVYLTDNGNNLRAHVKYILDEQVSTPYGNASKYYYDRNAYVIFKNNTCIAYENDLNAAFRALAPETGGAAARDGSWAAILLTKNLTDTSTLYDNIVDINSDITVDLGGYTLTDGKTTGTPLFNACAKRGTAVDRYITVKNGKLVLNPNSLGLVQASAYWSGTADAWNNYYAASGNTSFNYVFDTVNIKYQGAPGVVDYMDNNASCAFTTPGREMILSMAFNNCTFDLSSAGGTLFNAKDPVVTSTTGYVDGRIAESVVKITVDGGTIQAKNAAQAMSLFNYDSTITAKNLAGTDVTSSVIFVDNGGSYTKLTVPTGTDVAETLANYQIPTDETAKLFYFNMTGGESGVDTYIVTELPSVFTTVKPLSNITLESDLLYNIYFKVIPEIASYTVDGVTYTVGGNAKTIEIGGVSYYVTSTSLPASAAAREIPVTVTVTAGGQTRTKAFTMSIIGYSEKLLKNTDTDAVSLAERQVIRDMLNYIRAAYNYFESADRAAVTAKIDTLLSGYSVGFTASADTSSISEENKNKYGIYAMSFALEATPKLRVCFTDKAKFDAYNLTFVGSGNILLDTTKAEGTYSDGGNVYYYYEIELFAYSLYESISIRDGGREIGTLHMNSYMAGVTDGSALDTLMTGLAKYSQSAREYKDAWDAANR